jgi:hypothetical protein
MIKLLKKLFALCDHEWIDHGKQNYVETSYDLYLPFTVIQCKCSKCGAWKTFTIKR